MKKLSILAFCALLLTLLNTSCDPDTGTGGGGGLSTPPSLTFLSGTGYTSSDATINAGGTFTVQLAATAGSEDISSLAIYENDVLIPNSRISIFGGSSGSGNPIPINSTDAGGFTWDISIVAHSTFELKTYRFTIVDVLGDSNSQSLLIDTAPATEFSFELRADSGCISTDASNVSSGSLMKFCPVMTSGAGGDLTKITIFEDGVSITDLSRLRFGTITNDFEGNPLNLTSEFANVLDTVIYIKAHDSGTKTYDIIVEDASGATLTKTVEITIESSGVPVSNITAARLFNSGGPSGTGGLDLDDGDSTGSSDASAEIRDLGTAANWTMQFAPITANNVNLRASTADFDNTFFKEEVAAAYNAGTDVSNATAVIGDVYAVERDGVFYLLKVVDVVEVSDNSDYIMFDIKK